MGRVFFQIEDIRMLSYLNSLHITVIKNPKNTIGGVIEYTDTIGKYIENVRKLREIKDKIVLIGL